MTDKEITEALNGLLLLTVVSIIGYFVAGGRGICLVWLGMLVEWLDGFRVRSHKL